MGYNDDHSGAGVTLIGVRSVWPATADGVNPVSPLPRCIHHWFELQALATPEAVAVVSEERTLTYRELNERANRLAHYLHGQGVRPGVLAGLCLDRKADLVVGILGILKAGGAYLPLDLAYPKERVDFILQDAAAQVVVTQASLARSFGEVGTRKILIDAEWSEIEKLSPSNPGCTALPEDLAYVIYTSGSTGQPKGSLITHHNVVRLFRSTEAWFQFTSADVWTLFHSAAFDFSVWELWGALLYGGRLVVVPFPVSRTPEAFYQLLQREKVTVLNQTPSAFRQLIRAEEAGEMRALALRLIIFGGEALDMKTLRPWFDRHGDQCPQLVNMYGITETTVHVTYRRITAADLMAGSVIGVPIPDLQVYLLDEQMNPVPHGGVGEIYVGGAGVGKGYLRRDELTSVRFVPDPFVRGSSARLYRSGDLGRLLPNGDLEYLGRIDHQVKIHGFRIELGEIEAILSSQPGVRETVVVAREDSPGEKRLVAYLIPMPGASIDAQALRRSLKDRLPQYMIPAAFMFIENLPLTVNGKLDVDALPVPDETHLAAWRSPFVAPETDLQREVAKIWCDLMRISKLGLDDNFFDLGGDSVLMAQAHTRLEDLIGRRFSITELFTHPTVRTLATYLSSPGLSEGGLTDVQERARLRQQAMRRTSPTNSR